MYKIHKISEQFIRVSTVWNKLSTPFRGQLTWPKLGCHREQSRKDIKFHKRARIKKCLRTGKLKSSGEWKWHKGHNSSRTDGWTFGFSSECHHRYLPRTFADETGDLVQNTKNRLYVHCLYPNSVCNTYSLTLFVNSQFINF